MLPSEILDNAANIILRDGWIQGQYYREIDYGGPDREADREAELEANRSAPCCQEGAISRAAYGYAWLPLGGPDVTAEAKMARARANDYMLRHIRATTRFESSILWNDQGGRTKEEVVAALRAAADMARGAGE